MIVDFLTDGHVHTHLCMHAHGTMEEYVQSAIEKGLRRLIFHEHMEEGINYFERTWLSEDDFDFYFKEVERLKLVYGHQINIGIGVEVGYNPECPEKLIKRLSKRRWDRIGLSYHYCRLPGSDNHLNVLSRKQKNIKTFLNHGTSRLLTHYYETLIKAVQIIPADVICHLDAGLRHVPNITLEHDHLTLVDRLLDQVKASGLALELNTSGYVKRDSPYPSFDIVSKAQKRDIQMVVGSDAHSPSQIGRYFKRLSADLSNLDN